MSNEFYRTWKEATPSAARNVAAMRAVLRMGGEGLNGLSLLESCRIGLDALRAAVQLGGIEAVETLRIVAAWIEENGHSPFDDPGNFWDPELIAEDQLERRRVAAICLDMALLNDIDGGPEPWEAAMRQASFRIAKALGRARVLASPHFGPLIAREAAEHARFMGLALPEADEVHVHPGQALLATYRERAARPRRDQVPARRGAASLGSRSQ